MHGYIYIYLDMIYVVITLPKAGYDNANIPLENQSMLPQSVFANIATVLLEKEIQCQIEASLHLNEPLDEILAHL
jgi:hypothetical protein